MKKSLLLLVAIFATAVLFFSLPLTSVAVLKMIVVDQNDKKITHGAKATYLDETGATIVEITSKTRGSWDNNLHWWSHSKHRTSKLRPEDAMRAVSVRIDAEGCQSATFPVDLLQKYEPLSFALHGGGSAHFSYKYEQIAIIQCG